MLRAFCSIAALALASCAQQSGVVIPDAPVPQVWPATTWRSSGASVSNNWKAFFPDPQLQVYIGAALENNRDLRLAAARVQESRAQYGIADSERKPSVSLSGAASVVGLPATLSDTGDAKVNQRYDINLTAASFELDFWGRLAGLSDAARFEYLATEEAGRTVRLALIADVATTYFSKLQAEELLLAANATIRSREKSLLAVSKAIEIGGASSLDLLQESSLMESAKANAEGLEHQRSQAINRLNFLTGNIVLKLPSGLSLQNQGMDLALSKELPSEVLLARPDVMAAEQKLRAAHANVDAARAAFFPRIVLNAGLGMAGQGLASILSGTAWTFQPTIAMPLFNGGRLHSSQDIAEARKVASIAEYEKIIQMAFREIADLLSLRRTVDSQLRAYEAIHDTKLARLRAISGRFDAGFISYQEVLEAERDVLISSQNVTQARRMQLETVTLLYKALGGGD